MKLAGTVVLLVLHTGFATAWGAGGSGPSPSPGVQPARKRELPWLNVPGGRMKTTLYYGPWQCRREFMSGCQTECASKYNKAYPVCYAGQAPWNTVGPDLPYTDY